MLWQTYLPEQTVQNECAAFPGVDRTRGAEFEEELEFHREILEQQFIAFSGIARQRPGNSPAGDLARVADTSGRGVSN